MNTGTLCTPRQRSQSWERLSGTYQSPQMNRDGGEWADTLALHCLNTTQPQLCYKALHRADTALPGTSEPVSQRLHCSKNKGLFVISLINPLQAMQLRSRAVMWGAWDCLPSSLPAQGSWKMVKSQPHQAVSVANNPSHGHPPPARASPFQQQMKWKKLLTWLFRIQLFHL